MNLTELWRFLRRSEVSIVTPLCPCQPCKQRIVERRSSDRMPFWITTIHVFWPSMAACNTSCSIKLLHDPTYRALYHRAPYNGTLYHRTLLIVWSPPRDPPSTPWNLLCKSVFNVSMYEGTYIYVYIYVCMYICVYVYMYICVHVYVYICICIYVYMHMRTYVYMYIYLCI